MNEHEATHDADELGATGLLEDPVSLVSRALRSFGNEIRALRGTLQQSVDDTNQRLGQIEYDVRLLINLDAVAVARDQANLIADQLGLSHPRQLCRREIMDLFRNHDNSDIPPEDLRRLQRADLILAATDADGELNYVVVEAAYIASTEHVLGAMINADLLAKLTRCLASGVIAAARIDQQIQNDADEAQVVWYQLDNWN